MMSDFRLPKLNPITQTQTKKHINTNTTYKEFGCVYISNSKFVKHFKHWDYLKLKLYVRIVVDCRDILYLAS